MSLGTFFLTIASYSLPFGKQVKFYEFAMKSKHTSGRSLRGFDVECLVDGRIFHADSAVLCCFSPYFEKKLLNVDGYLRTDKIRIPKIEANAFEVLLRFMYTRRLDVNCNNFLDVYKAAFLLSMSDVQKECLQKIDGKDKIRTYFYSYILLKKCGLQQDCQKQFEQITHRFEETALSKEFMELDVHYVLEILSAPTIGARSEIIVFLSALNWLKHDFARRRIFTVTVLGCVRFSSMTMEEIIACYHPPFLPQVVENPQVKAMLYRATSYIAAKMQGQESTFRQYSSPERKLTMKSLPLVLWYKHDDSVDHDGMSTDPSRLSEFIWPKETILSQQDYYPPSWQVTEKVTKCNENVLTVTEKEDDTGYVLEMNKLSDSLNFDPDLSVGRKTDMEQLFGSNGLLEGYPKSDEAPDDADSESPLEGIDIDAKGGRAREKLKKITGFLRNIVKSIAGKTGQENRSLEKGMAREQATKFKNDKFVAEMFKAEKLMPERTTSVGESFITSMTQMQLPLIEEVGEICEGLGSKEQKHLQSFYKELQVHPEKLTISVTEEETKVTISSEQVPKSSLTDVRDEISGNAGNDRRQKLQKEKESNETLSKHETRTPFVDQERECLEDLIESVEKKQTEEKQETKPSLVQERREEQTKPVEKKQTEENQEARPSLVQERPEEQTKPLETEQTEATVLLDDQRKEDEDGTSESPEAKVDGQGFIAKKETDTLDKNLSSTRIKEANGMLFVVGGLNPKNLSPEMGSMVHAYDLSRYEGLSYCALPKPRHSQSVVVVNNFLFVIGGCSSKDTFEKAKYIPRRTCFRLDINNKKWATMASMKYPRFDHGAVVYRGLIYAFGGQGEMDKLLKFVEIYDPCLNRWTVSNSTMCCARKAMGIAVYRDHIWIAGGFIDTDEERRFRATSLVDCYNPIEKSWSFTIYSLPSPRCFCSLTVWDGKLFCIAGMALIGKDRVGPLGEVWYVESEDQPWQRAPALPEPKIGGVAVTYGDTIYFLGGHNPTSNDDSSKIAFLTRGAGSWKSGPAQEPHLFGLSAVSWGRRGEAGKQDE